MIHIVDRVSSTNTWLSRNSMRANDGIIALQQTRGKGRGVRVWESPLGGLYLSIISPSHSLLPFIDFRSYPLSKGKSILRVANLNL